MSDNFRSLIKKYRAFYEVSPYYVVAEEKHGSPTDKSTRRIQAGFDVDVYGVNINNTLAVPGPDPEYRLGYDELRKIAQDILQHHANDFSSIDVISFPEGAILNTRNQAKGQASGRAKVNARLRIRISHRRGLEQPAGRPEEQLLKEVEKQLQGLGLTRQ
jgi:hypothetical protein